MIFYYILYIKDNTLALPFLGGMRSVAGGLLETIYHTVHLNAIKL